ncbi:DUF4129 domain-containing protein [Luteibacter sp.]|uniref:DUF4129 domain-containing protein n=1 Tax=Luteibacter sp. TaxID=1886636 RepID=UPI003F80DB99
MEIERIAVVLRLRSARESMDLGAAMLRRHARPIFTAWFMATLPVLAIAIALEIWLDRPWLSLLLLWWLKPFFARIPLFVVSRAVFAEAPGWREALRSTLGWGLKGVLPWLTFRRFDPRRCVFQPVFYLEGLSGQERARRWRVFGRGVDGPGTSLTFTCLIFELVVMLSLLLFVPMFVPTELWESYWLQGWFLRSMPYALAMPLIVGAYLGMSLAEPLCTTGGFALYLGRRTELEAWDLDLAFQRLRNRLVAAGASMVLFVAACFAIQPAHAADDAQAAMAKSRTAVQLDAAFKAPQPGTDERLDRISASVLADPLLGGKAHETRWALKHPPQPKPPPKVNDAPVRELNMAGAAVTLKVILLALLVAAVAWLAWFAVRRWPSRGQGRTAAPEAPRTAVTETTPDEAPVPRGFGDEVGSLWQKGARREALALLYRGTVERVSAQLDEPVMSDATEADAIAGARRLDDNEASRRAIRIVRTWQYAAYADRFPADEDLHAMLRGWPVEIA